MSLQWEYQKIQYQLYRQRWDEERRIDLKLYRREYRKQHPEATRAQWRRDTQRYRARHDPDELRERRRIYDARYQAKLKAKAGRDNKNDND